MNDLYVITFIESGEILTPDSFKKYWPNYGVGGSSLCGWKPPKKVYYSEAKAKVGFSFVPDALKPMLEISLYSKTRSIINGIELQKQQTIKKQKRKLAIDKRNAKFDLERAKINLKQAQEQLDKIEKKQYERGRN